MQFYPLLDSETLGRPAIYFGAGSIQEGITLYQYKDFKGDMKTYLNSIYDLGSFNDKASAIFCGSGRWYAFQHKDFEGDKYGPFIRTGNAEGRYKNPTWGPFKDNAISSLYKEHDASTLKSASSQILGIVKGSVESHKKEFTSEAASFVNNSLTKLNHNGDASFCQYSTPEWNKACPPIVLKQWAQKNWKGVANYMDSAVNHRYKFKVVAGNMLIPEVAEQGGYYISPEDVAADTSLPKMDDWQAWNPPGFDKYDLQVWLPRVLIGGGIMAALLAMIGGFLLIRKLKKPKKE